MVKINKNIFAFAIAITVIMLLSMFTPFVAATNENKNNENETTGDVQLTVTNWDDEAHTVDIYVDGISEAQKWLNASGTRKSKDKITFRDLEEGNHTFLIKWFDCDDNADHEDSKMVKVIAGKTAYLTLNIYRILGEEKRKR